MKQALVVVDVQEYLINQHIRELPKKIAEFIDSHKLDFVLFTKFVNDLDSNWVKIWKWKGMLKEEETKIAPELRKFLNGDNVFVKRAAFSVFKAKGFKDFLRVKDIKKLYICGMDTNACVYVSVFEAFELGFNIKMLEDLCGTSFGERYNKMALELLKTNLGEKVVITSKDVK